MVVGPNSLRFKVRRATNDPKQVVGVIFHVPCSPPKAFDPQLPAIQATWLAVHRLLDELNEAPNARQYASIVDPERRKNLRPGLDRVVLTRVAT